jgi:hypothetical protein
MATCKQCGAELSGRADQLFCSDNKNKCKMAYWRAQHKKDQSEAQDNELSTLRTKVQDQDQHIAELEQETIRLRALLDIEQRYHADHERRSFKAWLKKQPTHAIGDLGQRILADELIPALGSRAGYEARLRYREYSPDDQQEFAHLWKLMLLQ